MAADGGRSTVRRALAIGLTGETVDPAPMVVADVRLRAGALDRDHWHLFPGADGGFAALCPLPGTDEYQFVARTDNTRIHRGQEDRGDATRQLGLGYRAPDGPLPDGRRLFDLFRGPQFTLLAVGTDAELPCLNAEFLHIHRIGPYEPYGKGLFLVRPDGYVGWAGEDATGLARYLARLARPASPATAG